MAASMPPEFAVTWAIVLEPLDGGRTRLIERIRGSFGQATPGSRALGPLLGFGIFVMTQRQMLGIKARAERVALPWRVIAQRSATAPSSHRRPRKSRPLSIERCSSSSSGATSALVCALLWL